MKRHKLGYVVRIPDEPIQALIRAYNFEDLPNNEAEIKKECIMAYENFNCSKVKVYRVELVEVGVRRKGARA